MLEYGKQGNINVKIHQKGRGFQSIKGNELPSRDSFSVIVNFNVGLTDRFNPERRVELSQFYGMHTGLP